MEPNKLARGLTHEITDYFLLPDSICFEFIHQRILWAMAIGYDLCRTTNRNKGKMVVQMTMSGKTLRVFATQRDAERRTGIGRMNISNVCRGKQKSAGGYKWRFLDANAYYEHIKIK